MNKQVTTPPAPAADWRMVYLQEVMADDNALDNLFNILHLARDIRESINPEWFVSELFSYYVIKDHIDLNKDRHDISGLFSLLARLNRLREEFDNLDQNSDYSEVYDKVAYRHD